MDGSAHELTPCLAFRCGNGYLTRHRNSTDKTFYAGEEPAKNGRQRSRASPLPSIPMWQRLPHPSRYC